MYPIARACFVVHTITSCIQTFTDVASLLPFSSPCTLVGVPGRDPPASKCLHVPSAGEAVCGYNTSQQGSVLEPATD